MKNDPNVGNYSMHRFFGTDSLHISSDPPPLERDTTPKRRLRESSRAARGSADHETRRDEVYEMGEELLGGQNSIDGLTDLVLVHFDEHLTWKWWFGGWLFVEDSVVFRGHMPLTSK